MHQCKSITEHIFCLLSCTTAIKGISSLSEPNSFLGYGNSHSLYISYIRDEILCPSGPIICLIAWCTPHALLPVKINTEIRIVNFECCAYRYVIHGNAHYTYLINVDSTQWFDGIHPQQNMVTSSQRERVRPHGDHLAATQKGRCPLDCSLLPSPTLHFCLTHL